MLGSKYRGRRQGIEVREGAVRHARKHAGLSLAQVAAGKVSRTAILYIENGRTKPSMETLRLISKQTRFPINYFLLHPEGGARFGELPEELVELERLTAAREFRSVVDLAQQVLKKQSSDSDAALVRFYLGQACCRLVRPEEALRNLTAARRDFEARGDEDMAVEALDWESTTLGYLEDPQALPLAESALERCRALDPKPAQTEARILGHIANLHVVGHSWAQATYYYQSAADAAGAIKDLLLEAKMHHGLGAVFIRTSQPLKARDHYNRALALYAIESDPAATYRVENDLGYLLLQEGHLDSAEAHLVTALDGSAQHDIDRRGRGFILCNLGHVNLRRGELAVARDYLEEALECGDATGEGLVRAEAHQLLGKLAEHESEPGAADEHYGIAIGILEQVGMPERLRDLHMDYAAVLDARGDTDSSVRHWRRAAELGKLESMGLKWSSAQKLLEMSGTG